MKPDLSLRGLTWVLILINAAFWLAFAFLTAFDLHPGLPDEPWVRWGMTGLALAASLGLIGLHWLAKRGWSLAYFFLLTMLGLICLVTLLDEFGWTDLIILITHALCLDLLIRDREGYLTLSRMNPGS